MGTTFVAQLAVDIAWVDCCVCGIQFGVPANWDQKRRRAHDTFYCPNGHHLSYNGPSKEERRIKELEATKAQLEARLMEQRADLELEQKARKQVQKELSTTKGALTRTKKRIANGVCPCCQRSFQNLQRHMAAKHPDFTTAEAPAQ